MVKIFELIGEEIKKENPDLTDGYIESLTWNRTEEENIEWTKLEQNFEDELAKRYGREKAKIWIKALDIQWMLEYFENIEDYK